MPSSWSRTCRRPRPPSVPCGAPAAKRPRRRVPSIDVRMTLPNSVPRFQDAVIQQIAQVVGDAYSGSNLTRIFDDIGLDDLLGEGATKWKRIDQALCNRQRHDRVGNVVIAFVQAACSSGRVMSSICTEQALLDGVNLVLALEGYQVRLGGKVVKGARAETLTEATKQVASVVAELKRRSVHPKVLRCCERELMEKNLFHGVQEATKSVFDRLRTATGSHEDGWKLVDYCFVANQGCPRVAINTYQSQTDKSMHQGLASAIKAAYSLWRNPTAHELRVKSVMPERDVLDAMTLLSYVHRQLDNAVVTGTGAKV